MSKKVKPSTYALEPSQIRDLESIGKKLGISKSELVRQLIKRFLHIIANEENQTPIVFNIPDNLRDDPEKLRVWLNTRTNALVSKLCS